MRHVVVVGASLAGLRAAETLRQEGFDGRLTMVGAEARRPYNRPPLSKQLLTGKHSPEQLDFPDVDALGAEWRLGRVAVRLHAAERRVVLDDGTEIAFDGAVLATGVVPRLPGVPGWDLPGTHLLRTLDDALALRAELRPGRHLVVVGAGFIGCEVAASARELGLAVTLVDPVGHPMSRLLPPELGAVFSGIHAEKGVDLLFGRAVTAIGGDSAVCSVTLDDGSILPADAVVFGGGSLPATDWLTGSGLVLGNGIQCDAFCLARGGGGRIAAAGDVAAWPNLAYGGAMMRVEHWSNAVDQATAAARNLFLGPRQAYTPLMSMWSDQYEYRLQALGAPAFGSRMAVAQGSVMERRFLAEFHDGERLTGIVALNMPARVAGYRRRLMEDVAAEAGAAPLVQNEG